MLNFKTYNLTPNHMKYIFGNWKMYLNHEESVAFAEKLKKEKLKDKNIEIAVFPTALAMLGVEKVLKKSGVSFGAQNCAWVPKGAYTGAISALMFKEAGCKYALVGHSERRHVFGESNDDVRKKLEAVIDIGLIPVLCIGETKEDKDNNKTSYRLERQLMDALQGLSVKGDEIIVAYEPVWAIGTNNPCLPADADDIHGFIKQELKKYIKEDVAVLYGGSVTADNVASYTKLETIDGVLVGGASVKKDTFMPLVKAVRDSI